MPFEDARNFVEKMREDRVFREKVLQTENPEDLALFLRGEQMRFDQRELAGAMAECMAQMEQQTAD
ncbi:MAG: Nif11-like leader peptide family natural product precursor [Deltaproteobacteria bacterium]|nr:Nif11-like leader peptide family natural product precursor [Deltaproteobacteria bacterium]